MPLRLVNTATEPLHERFSYQVVLVPSGRLVAAAIDNCEAGGLVDIFAGIPAQTRQEIDLDAYIVRRCYMFGTSGSVIRDMKALLEKISSGQIDTNCSVDAVSGMAGAIDGVEALEKQTVAGKIIIYPMLHDLGLTRLAELAERFPSVAPSSTAASGPRAPSRSWSGSARTVPAATEHTAVAILGQLPPPGCTLSGIIAL